MATNVYRGSDGTISRRGRDRTRGRPRRRRQRRLRADPDRAGHRRHRARDQRGQAVPRARPALRDRAAARQHQRPGHDRARARQRRAAQADARRRPPQSRPAGAFVSPSFNLSLRLENPALPGNTSTVTVMGVKLDQWDYSHARGRLRHGEGRLPGAVDEGRGRHGGVIGQARERAHGAPIEHRRSAGRRRQPSTRSRSRRRCSAVPADGNGAIAGEVVLRAADAARHPARHAGGEGTAVLTSVLMVQQALVEPKLTVEQVGALPAGARAVPAGARSMPISGLGLGEDELDEAVKAPLARACFVLAQRVRLDAERVRRTDRRPGAALPGNARARRASGGGQGLNRAPHFALRGLFRQAGAAIRLAARLRESETLAGKLFVELTRHRAGRSGHARTACHRDRHDDPVESALARIARLGRRNPPAGRAAGAAPKRRTCRPRRSRDATEKDSEGLAAAAGRNACRRYSAAIGGSRGS